MEEEKETEKKQVKQQSKALRRLMGGTMLKAIAKTTTPASHKSKRQARQDKRIDKRIASGSLKVTPGYKDYDRSILFVQMMWRIFYVTVYYYLIPFSTVAMSTYSIFFWLTLSTQTYLKCLKRLNN